MGKAIPSTYSAGSLSPFYTSPEGFHWKKSWSLESTGRLSGNIQKTYMSTETRSTTSLVPSRTNHRRKLMEWQPIKIAPKQKQNYQLTKRKYHVNQSKH